MVLEELSGPGRRCEGATDDEVIGMLGRWAAQESWAAAGKLALVRELIRRRPLRDRNGTPATGPGDLPGCWDAGLGHEISAALGISLQAADKILGLAWTLQTRLPRIGQALEEGILDFGKAKIIAEETAVLDDQQVGAAENLILAAGLTGKTWTKLQQQAADAACTIDPDGTRKRRERAQRDDARVRLWREASGTCALAAYGLPPDEALAANAGIDQRAQEYRDAGLTHPLDLLRVMAYADLINGIPARDRITRARAETAGDDNGGPVDGSGGEGPDGDGTGNGSDPDGNSPDGNSPGGNSPGGNSPGGNSPDNGSGNGGGDPGSGGADQNGPDCGPDEGGPDASRGREDGDGALHSGAQPVENPRPGRPRRPVKANLTAPLATILGHAERPGTAHGLGPLDPDLARKLTEAAARNPDSEWCITVIDDQYGHAIAHGCARPARGKPPPGSTAVPLTTRAALAARTHLTIRLADLRTLAGRAGTPATSQWSFTPQSEPAPPREPCPTGEQEAWTLILPGGRHLTVKLNPIPVTSCDHRYETPSYKPGDLLRHLVQVRDGECTFPTCTRHARETDFEHGIPYDKGGRTCACNAGTRSRRCHRVKQSTGWNLTQPRPGWHQWTTPSGRVYTQGPAQYSA